MPTVTVTLEVEVNPDWIQLCTTYNDLFIPGYCGYWLQGVERDDKLGWLVYCLDEDNPTQEATDSAIEAWEAGEELPEGWYRLNEELAIKAWAEGVKKFGINWYEDGDADTYDYVIQMAMLGEIVYG